MKKYGKVAAYIGAAVIAAYGALVSMGCEVFTPGFGDRMECTRGYEEKGCGNCHTSIKSLQAKVEANDLFIRN